MFEGLSLWIVGALVVVFILFLFGGAVQTFRRQPIVAILCVIFLFRFLARSASLPGHRLLRRERFAVDDDQVVA